MEFTLPLIVIPVLFLIAISTMFQRKARRLPDEIELGWGEINFFERHGASSEGRIEAALYLGCEKLGLPNALVTLQQAENCCVHNVASIDGSGDLFVVGQVLPRALLYCGALNRDRPSLSIDFAGISDWRMHRAHRDLGWESYVGVRRELSTGEGITVAFYGSRSRDLLFSPAEKRLVGQLGDWVATILERERGFSAEARGEYPETVARA